MPKVQQTPALGAALKRLEEIVRQLEQPVELEAAMALYEEGLTLTRLCNTRLTEARVKIEQLSLDVLDA